jgi:outer membrane cobalamin receptor
VRAGFLAVRKDSVFHSRRCFLNALAIGLIAAIQFAPLLAAVASELIELETIEISATRIPEAVDRVPANITVITGAELRARGVTDLRTALMLVAGVEAPPGGDTGPAGAVPSFWGLHEFDAFLLVVDGVPWGGAFNPSIPTLNLTNVERIEVLKGPTPVLFGATSFVGVIQVIHYSAGQAANEAQISYGSFGSVGASASTALPMVGECQRSIAANNGPWSRLAIATGTGLLTKSNLSFTFSETRAGSTENVPKRFGTLRSRASTKRNSEMH